MSDPQTLKAYAAKADDYARMTAELVDPLLAEFLADLPDGGHVLDLGCGPGREAGLMADAGFRVMAVDAVPEMVALAARNPNVETRIMRFDELTERQTYDGVWCNFSLLHAPRAAMPHHLAAIARALKPGGYLHLALKTGAGSRRDSFKRFYTYYEEQELRQLLAEAGLSWVRSRTGRGKGLSGLDENWIAVVAHA